MFGFFKKNRKKPEPVKPEPVKVESVMGEKPGLEIIYPDPDIDEKGRTLAIGADEAEEKLMNSLRFEVTYQVTEVHTDETIERRIETK